MSIPVVALATVDPVVRESSIFAAVTGAPRTGVLRTDLDPLTGILRRTILDFDGVHEDETLPLEHTCWGCAVREDSLPTLERMAGSGRWDRILVALPVGAETAPLAGPLGDDNLAARLGVSLAAIVAAVDLATLRAELFSDELLTDRGRALSADDLRSGGEALAGQLRHADLILTDNADEVAAALVEHLRGAGSAVGPLFDTSTEDLFFPRHFPAEAAARIDPAQVQPSATRSDAGGRVWTLDLISPRPLHPGRLHAAIESFVHPEVVSRGRFMVAGRPGTLCEWDGVASQLSIGSAGQWPAQDLPTRLVFTGTADVRRDLLAAFRSVLATEAELRIGRSWPEEDGFEPWLGGKHLAA